MMRWIYAPVITILALTVSGIEAKITLETRKAKRLELKGAIEKVVRSYEERVHIGIEVVDLKTGEVIYRRNSQQLFIPAGVAQLFTGAAALEILGGGYRFSTDLLATGLEEQQCQDLYLVGSGDPDLNQLALQLLVTSLKEKGVQQVLGNLYLDLSLFDSTPLPGAEWDDGDSARLVVAPLAMRGEKSVEPHQVVANYLVRQLEQCGIKFEGKIALASPPEGATAIAQHLSRPLSQLLLQMGKESDSYVADCLFKRMGASLPSSANRPLHSWARGSQAVRNWILHSLYISQEGVVLMDGAGESRYNLISPHATVELLQKAASRLGSGSELVASLSVAGIDGTLQERMQHPSLKGRIRAKSGALQGVSVLAGYAESLDRRTYAFAIFLNNFIGNREQYRVAIEEEICSLLVGTPTVYKN